MERSTYKHCACCNNDKSFAQFYKSPLIGTNKYLPYCKLCCSNKLKQYTQATGNEKAALWCLLAELGVPFKAEVWEATQQAILQNKTQGRKPELFNSYLRFYNELGIIAHGFWESDVMLTAFYGEEKSVKTSQDVIDYEEEVLNWGRFEKDGELDKEAYLYLNKTFDSYTDGLLEMDTNLINRYRDLAKAEWRKRKADESGDIQEIAKAQDNLKKMLDMLKLSDFQSNQISDEKRAFEYNVSLIENYHPAECEELKEYLDKVGYEKEKAIPMRSIGNAIAGTREYPDIPKEYQ